MRLNVVVARSFRKVHEDRDSKMTVECGLACVFIKTVGDVEVTLFQHFIFSNFVG